METSEIIIVDGPGALNSQKHGTIITQYAFRNRFTIAEKVAIEESALVDPIVRVVLKDFDSAMYIDLTRQETQDGVGIFVQQALLTEPRAREILSIERATEILNSPATDSEVPWFFQH